MSEEGLRAATESDLMDELDELERLRLLGALDDPAAGRRLHALASQVEGPSELGELRVEALPAEEAPRRGLAWPAAVAAVVGAAALGVAVGRWQPQGPNPSPSSVAGGEAPSGEAPSEGPSPMARPSAVVLNAAPSPTASPSPPPQASPPASPVGSPPRAHPAAATSKAPAPRPQAAGPASAGPHPSAKPLPVAAQPQARQPAPAAAQAMGRPLPAWRPTQAPPAAPAIPSPVVRLPEGPKAAAPVVASHPSPAALAPSPGPTPEHWRRPHPRPPQRASAPAWPAGEALVHVVRPGESLWAIAEAQSGQGQAWTELWAANQAQVPQPRLIHPGQRLRLPRGAGAHPAPVAVVVRPGDSLSALAQRHLGQASAWPRLWRANRASVPNPHLILPGQQLALPWARPRAEQQAKPAPAWKPPAARQLRRSRAAWAVVRPGESLWSIAQRSYGTGLAWRRIMALNRHRIASPEALVPGTLLRLR